MNKVLFGILGILLSFSASGFDQVTAPKSFDFPLDHGAHVNFQNEWWYVTLNLEDEQGRPIGAQFTLFRFGLKPESSPINSWQTHHVYMAHTALTLPHEKRFLFEEKFSRDSFDLAGVTAVPFRAWLHDWALHSNDMKTIHLDMSIESAELNLILKPTKPLVLQGEQGLSQKGPKPGQASYYYSLPRLMVSGRLEYKETEHNVTGTGWFDREWSTQALDQDQSGWTWFALKLEDNTEIMLYLMQRKDGQRSPHDYAVLIDSDGQKQQLNAEPIRIEPLALWRGPDGQDYATAWSIKVPELAYNLKLEAIWEPQWIPGSVNYWEGAVTVSGDKSGTGYVEQFIQQSKFYQELQTVNE